MDRKKKIDEERAIYEAAREADRKRSLVDRMRNPDKILDKAIAAKGEDRKPASVDEDTRTPRQKALGRIIDEQRDRYLSMRDRTKDSERAARNVLDTVDYDLKNKLEKYKAQERLKNKLKK